MGENGILRGSRMKTLIDLSTTGPSVAKVVAKAAGDRQVAWVDSPVSGGVAGATTRSCPSPRCWTTTRMMTMRLARVGSHPLSCMHHSIPEVRYTAPSGRHDRGAVASEG